MLSIFYHTKASFAELIFQELGKGRLHAEQLYSHFMKNGTLDGLLVEPQARVLVEKMISMVDFSLSEGVRKTQEGETSKFLFKDESGLEYEAVHIPMKTKKTLCISSQVGCQRGCTFCETGRMGLLRSLSSEEIVSQVFCVIHQFDLKVDNIVFMGMGEPLDNFENVMRAVDVLTDDSGLSFGPSRISISTSGVVDKIYELSKRADPALNLAVSVNAPNDQIRKKIMPINRKWDMRELKKAMVDFCSHPRRKILVEYVLLEGINDSLESADELAAYLKGLKVKVNLIPYNPQSKDRFAPPPQDVLDAFLKRMCSHGYLTFLRQTKGRNIMAACGQLGNVSLRRARNSDIGKIQFSL